METITTIADTILPVRRRAKDGRRPRLDAIVTGRA